MRSKFPALWAVITLGWALVRQLSVSNSCSCKELSPISCKYPHPPNHCFAQLGFGGLS